MKDIFDIIETRKDKHIKIKGEISEYTLCYDMDTINDFYSILLDNTDHMDVTTFNINENNDSIDMSIYDITIEARSSTYKSIEFDIDIYVDNYLWRELSDFEDFIDYYTPGTIKYDNKHTSDSMVDRLEEYMSGRIVPDPEPVSSTIIWDESSSMDGDIGNRLFIIDGRPVIDYRSYDADGDAVFAAEFRPTDFSGMFRNCNNIDLSRLD
jgi:hypothetical protein